MPSSIAIRCRTATLLLLVYWTGLFLATHLPVHNPLHVNHLDKFVHFSAYLGLTVLFVFVVRMPSWPRLARYLLAASVLAIYGLLDETIQAFIPGRTADMWDWVADFLGIVAGLLFFGLLRAVIVSTRKQTSWSTES